MSDWQRAFAKRIHSRESIEHLLPPTEINGRVVRVRPFLGGGRGIALYREVGCDAEQFFEIHPHDAKGYNVIGCEHEILTD